MKKQLKKAEEAKNSELNLKKFKQDKTKASIYQRAEKILERKNKKHQQLQAKDLTTGRSMFRPDLNSSR